MATKTPTLTELFGEPISVYTRKQAIEDGTLIDVSSTAKEAGIKFSTAVTAAVWHRCVAVPAGCEGLQDEAGRLWDVLHMLRDAIQRSDGGSLIRYMLHVVLGPAWLDKLPPLIALKAVCGPGDDAEPVITIMLPEED